MPVQDGIAQYVLVEEHNVVTTALCLLERPDLIITSILKDVIALLEPFGEAICEAFHRKIYFCIKSNRHQSQPAL